MRGQVVLPGLSDTIGIEGAAPDTIHTKGYPMLRELRAYLDENGVKYVVLQHSEAYSAQEIAALAHIPGNELAKTVLISVRGKPAMAVLPASYYIDFNRLASAIATGDIYLMAEDEMKSLFPDCELGAMPPFGNLYGLDVYASEGLAMDDYIYFNACTHTELIKMAFSDYHDLVKPRIISFTTRVKEDEPPQAVEAGRPEPSS